MRNVYAGLSIAAALLCSAALAQNPPRPAVPARPGAENPAQPSRLAPLQGGTQQASALDQQIAAFIFASAHNEVELAKFAQEKLQTQQARAFAEKMVRDHTADCEVYERWAGHLAAGLKDPALDAAEPRTATRPDAARPAAPPPAAAPPRTDDPFAPRAGAAPLAGGRVEATAGSRPGGQLDWVAIHGDLARQCLASTKQEFARHQGAEFDKCFMGQQLAGHMKMVDELKVLRQHASPQFRQQIDKSAQVAQGHLQEARQIMEQIKDTPSERVSRRPEGDR